MNHHTCGCARKQKRVNIQATGISLHSHVTCTQAVWHQRHRATRAHGACMRPRGETELQPAAIAYGNEWLGGRVPSCDVGVIRVR